MSGELFTPFRQRGLISGSQVLLNKDQATTCSSFIETLDIIHGNQYMTGHEIVQVDQVLSNKDQATTCSSLIETLDIIHGNQYMTGHEIVQVDQVLSKLRDQYTKS
jgi:hypothetical protein